ncbi:MAG: succinate dehydrogenase assembly factor 2 [Burkholderia sp.]|nr:succinate dehydrogenase assembly factor 2 [Burkholderia sp.]
MNRALHKTDQYFLARLRWRSRRGLLENDLILERFLNRYEYDLTDLDIVELYRLLDLSDYKLISLLLTDKEPKHDICSPEMFRVLEMLRNI